MSKQDTPPISSSQESIDPAANGHQVLLVRADPEEQAARFIKMQSEMNSDIAKRVRPLPPSLDEFLKQYPEARLLRPTMPCPLCKIEIPIPHGSLRGYIEYLKATDPAAAEGPYRWEIRSGCQKGRKVKRSDIEKEAL